MRTLLVERGGGSKNVKLTIPDDARVTFGPFSPPTKDKSGYHRDMGDKSGTLRVYAKGGQTTASILAVVSNVIGFRDLGVVEYEEEVAREEGAIMWKSDKDGYRREEKVRRASEWVDPTRQITSQEEIEDGEEPVF